MVPVRRRARSPERPVRLLRKGARKAAATVYTAGRTCGTVFYPHEREPAREQTVDDPDAIYLDNHATTPVDPRVVKVVYEVLRSTFGNPNSVDHAFGARARAVVDEARVHIGALVGAEPSHVVPTSSATEAVRLALTHARRLCARKGRPLRVISSPTEHRAVLDRLEDLREDGLAEVRFLSVDRLGRLDLDELVAALRDGADLVCAMAANNEVGTIHPVERIAEAARAAGALVLVDATQAAGKLPLRARDWGVDYLTLSAHKIYGPKGAGALVLGTGLPWTEPKGGTPNVPAIAGLGEACRLRILEMEEDEARVSQRRDRLEVLLRDRIPGLVVNGDRYARLPGNLHVSVPGAPNDAILVRLYERVAISTGSACTAGAESPSHVLVAMGLEGELIEGALRIGVGKFNTDEEIERAGELIAAAALEVRETMRGRASATAGGWTE